MKFFPAEDKDHLDRYEAEDGTLLGIANEKGDIVAYVRRPDGTRGTAYGGPVYDPPEFTNVCGRRCGLVACSCWEHTFVCDHQHDLTPAELAVATVFANKVGWMTPAGVDEEGGHE